MKNLVKIIIALGALMAAVAAPASTPPVQGDGGGHIETGG